ncbi:HAD family hydrolase [Anaerocolumna sp. MB42-C2]|uniref:HAD family hydrolase n=1 Tax=Anaerocolumna sp. MB42-C2 TaxID=3070997 RepID=UPI0027DFCA1F|nr:HAD family hydrolase [Anaerocolumna sp. MB42-C2]WMJ86999.1 HAD hydrolase-like protein [Anaerocolumna sp. MB42-C2]
MKGVIFKFNHVLFRDFDRQKRAWRLFALAEFYKYISDTEFDQYVYGQSYKSVMEYLAGYPLTNQEVKEYALKQEIVYQILWRKAKEDLTLTCGAEFLLNELKERKIPRLLIMESQRANLDFYIENYGINKWFTKESILCVDNIVPGRTGSDFYVHILQEMNLTGKNYLVFEDSTSGVNAAKQAEIGRVVAIVPYKEHHIYESLHEVDDVIENFHEFNRFLLSE